MGQKVHPIGFRLGISADWNSRWYADKGDFAIFLLNDIEVREFLTKKLAKASVKKIEIERSANNALITIHTARPGIVIGKKGEDIERLRKAVAPMFGLGLGSIKMNIEEVRKPEVEAQLVSESISQQLERRIMFRRAMKRAVGNAMRLGALGVKVHVSGRLNGSEIARAEWYREGRVPLHTLRADIDYGFTEAKTSYGILGVKVWIYKGEVYDLEAKRQSQKKNASKGKRPGK